MGWWCGVIVMLNEADTRAKLIDPKLHQSGWTEDAIQREYYLTPETGGRVVLEGNVEKREKPRHADYLLRYRTYPVAIVEAKAESESHLTGMQQAKEYAARASIPFAYSSNGHRIEEYDFTTRIQCTLDRFPRPEELWERLGKEAYLPTVSPLLYPFHYSPISKMQPRYYQEQAIYRVIERIIRDEKRILLTMATGTGKTYVAFQIAWKLVKSGHMKRVLYLADRNVLRNQAYNTFEPFGQARDVIESGHALKSRDIYLSIYQAMYTGEEGKRLYQQYPPDFFDLIIIDECHRSGFGTWNEILQHFSRAVQLGMTATPKRDDNMDTYQYFGEPAYEYTLADGIEDGYLAIYKIHRVQTNLDKEGLVLGHETFTTKDFERVVRLPDRNDTIVRHLVSLVDAVDSAMNKTMIFCVDQEHAAAVMKRINNERSSLGIADYAVRIVSDEGEFGREMLERFQDNDKLTPVVATTVDLLTTGVDAPNVRNIVFLRPINSMVVFKQIVGRGSRICEEKGKLSFRIFDYVGCTELFEDPEFDGFPAFLEETDIEVEPVPETLPAIKETGPEWQPDKERGKVKKITISGLTVTIVEERYFEIEITATGQRLKPGEYLKLSQEEVAARCRTLAELRAAWADRDKREALMRDLEAQNVSPELLARLLEAPDADAYDLLAHLAFNAPLVSRDERAKAFLNRNQDFLGRFRGKAREILELLVDKYRVWGIEEIAKPEVFRVRPLSEYGTFTAIVELFEGARNLRRAVDELQMRLYAAA
jgi:type I restriction enzyme R subunit